MEIVIGIAVSILLAEAYVWLPSITKWFLNVAVSRVSELERERCLEEWAANLDAIPNSLWKFVHALSLIGAARQINADAVGLVCDSISDFMDDVATTVDRKAERLQVEAGSG